eukprot:UN07194
MIISAVVTHFIIEEPRKMKTDYLENISLQLNILTAFMLGFYLNEVINRWWAIRDDCIGQLWKSINNLCQIP